MHAANDIWGGSAPRIRAVVVGHAAVLRQPEFEHTEVIRELVAFWRSVASSSHCCDV